MPIWARRGIMKSARFIVLRKYALYKATYLGPSFRIALARSGIQDEPNVAWIPAYAGMTVKGGW